MESYLEFGIDLTKFTIMMVDDVKVNNKLIEMILKPYHFNLIQVGSGAEALDVFGQQTVDLILLDLMMPDMSGVDVLKKLRSSDGPGKTVPVIVVSALNSEQDITEALAEGANDFIIKPIIRERLVCSVMTHIKLVEANRIIKNK